MRRTRCAWDPGYFGHIGHLTPDQHNGTTSCGTSTVQNILNNVPPELTLQGPVAREISQRAIILAKRRDDVTPRSIVEMDSERKCRLHLVSAPPLASTVAATHCH
jgi:hypothetical protein